MNTYIRSATIVIGISRDIYITMKVKDVLTSELQGTVDKSLTSMCDYISRELPPKPKAIRPSIHDDEVDNFQ